MTEHTTSRRTRRRRRTALVVLSFAVFALVAGACGSSSNNAKTNDTSVGTTASSGGATASTSAGSTLGDASSTPGAPSGQTTSGVWPPSGAPPAAMPLDAVHGFATDYLDVAQPTIAGCTQVLTTAPEQCTATIKARGAGATTTVRVVGTDGNWQVVSASSADIKVTSPAGGASVTSTITIEGESTAFEGTIGVEVRAADWTTANKHVLAKATLQGGANGALGPLKGSVPLPAGIAKGPAVLVLYAGDASGQGTVTEATVVSIVIT